MKRVHVVLLSLAVVVAACADGGQRGSGITSAAGNVASVASGMASVGGIHVSVVDGDLATDTDAQGRFEVRGRFDGPTTLRFTRAADALAAELEVNAPAGGALVLANVHLDVHSGAAEVESIHVIFEGEVMTIDCAGGRVTLASTQRDPSDTDTYVLAASTSTLHGAHGDARTCTDLHAGDHLVVDGFFGSDGTIGHADVTVED